MELSERLRSDFLKELKNTWSVERLVKGSVPALLADKTCMLAAIHKDGTVLHYASKKLKDDRNVVLAAVRQVGRALQFADAFRTDKDVVLTAVAQDWRSFEFAADTLRADKEMVLAVVTQNASTLMFAADVIKSDRDVMLAAVAQDGKAWKWASNDLKNDKDILLTALMQFGVAVDDKEMVLAVVTQNASTLMFAADVFKSDRDVMLAAVAQDGKAWKWASNDLKNDKGILLTALMQLGVAVDENTTLKELMVAMVNTDKEVALAAVTNSRAALEFVSKTADFWKDKQFVLEVVKVYGSALEYAHDNLKSDEEVALAAVTNSSQALEFVSKTADFWKNEYIVQSLMKVHAGAASFASDDLLFNDSEMAKAAVRSNGFRLVHAPASVKADSGTVMAAVLQSGLMLEHAHHSLKDHVHIVLAAVSENGDALQHASREIKRNKELVLAAASKDGMALQHADPILQRDKDVVLAAVRQNGVALKFAEDRLNQDAECLKASGLWDEDQQHYPNKELVIQSVKFSLGKNTSPYATWFALAFKKDNYLKNFMTHNPNAWCKQSCDPKGTDLDHPCNGTLEKCQNRNKNMEAGKPCPTTCWRVSFRFHQEESQKTNGYMVQVEEFSGLGQGQKIETRMAIEVGLKVFRTFTDEHDKPNQFALKKIASAVQEWYLRDRCDMRLENIYIGASDYEEARPKYSDNPMEFESMADWRKRTKGY